MSPELRLFCTRQNGDVGGAVSLPPTALCGPAHYVDRITWVPQELPLQVGGGVQGGKRCPGGHFLPSFGGVFAQRAHSANYYGDYPGNNPENHASAESCTINSKLKNSNI